MTVFLYFYVPLLLLSLDSKAIEILLKPTAAIIWLQWSKESNLTNCKLFES